MAANGQAGGATYLNPVHRRDFPDPYVLKHAGEYWAYCTGFWRDGRCFGVMRSRDLVNWEELAGALEPLPGEHPCYWAPEVVYDNGRFLMYYSVGDERLMHIRVAVAGRPAGPFVDSGRRLTHEEFAIDAHVFADDDGARYLFYATDFLTHTHIGTGTVVDRMLDEFTLAGEPRPVTRARYDWQVYDPRRIEKGGVRWHTVEGPFVLKRKGRYYEMFSGGNWQNLTYGVSYATSDRVLRTDEWEQVADGARVLPVLRTVPEKVIGPGHNSVVRGPDNLQLFCVYHRWDKEAGRVLAVDRLDWAGERMIVIGPSTTPQPAPQPAAVTSFVEEDVPEGAGTGWEVTSGSRWSVRGGEARQEAREGWAEARRPTGGQNFVLEAGLRALDESRPGGQLGVVIYGGGRELLRFGLDAGAKQAVLRSAARGDGSREARLDLPGRFAPASFHLLRLAVNAGGLEVSLDEKVLRWQGSFSAQPDAVGLFTHGATAAFKGFALTIGWEDLFTEQVEPTLRGWQVLAGQPSWRVSGGQLHSPAAAGEAAQVIGKGEPLENYELVINARLVHEAADAAGGGYGIYAALPQAGTRGVLCSVERLTEGGWRLRCEADEARVFPLPETFDPSMFQQFRFRKHGARLSVWHEADLLGDLAVTGGPSRVGLQASRAECAFDMVRVTKIA